MKSEELLKRYKNGQRHFVNVDLQGENLHHAVLDGIVLNGANLSFANFNEASLCDSNLGRTYCYCTTFDSAIIRNTMLHRASFYGAFFGGASISDTVLTNARYSIPQFLEANWYHVSDELCTMLMQLNAASMPDGEESMNHWVNGEDYPVKKREYNNVVTFVEKKRLWKPGVPPSLFEIWERLAAEKNIVI